MARSLRPDVDDGWHHVMNRGIDHGDVFLHDRDRVEIGQLLGDVTGVLTTSLRSGPGER